jgi:hypothetical protein
LGTNAVDVYVGEHFEFPMVIFRKEIEPFWFGINTIINYICQ